ncbi:uncharacterized protein METZ01_LOCUS402887 [marine metagenome]|uniref:DUF309 domain-containing protein n=1 Tax=marine metagenome TaxID=408172 RepID=A0A382VU60_9ZZZZ
MNIGLPRYCSRVFPLYRYVPGLHPHPTNSPDGHSYGLEDDEPEKWDSELWGKNEDYLFGIDLYNYHYYWEAHEAWEGLWIASVRNSSEHRFLQGLIKCGAALLKIRMAKYEIQDLIGARNLSKSGMNLLSQVGSDNFMGLDILGFIGSYNDFVQPIHEDIVPTIDQKTPRIELIV